MEIQSGAGTMGRGLRGGVGLQGASGQNVCVMYSEGGEREGGLEGGGGVVGGGSRGLSMV